MTRTSAGIRILSRLRGNIVFTPLSRNVDLTPTLWRLPVFHRGYMLAFRRCFESALDPSSKRVNAFAIPTFNECMLAHASPLSGTLQIIEDYLACKLGHPFPLLKRYPRRSNSAMRGNLHCFTERGIAILRAANFSDTPGMSAGGADHGRAHAISEIAGKVIPFSRISCRCFTRRCTSARE